MPNMMRCPHCGEEIDMSEEPIFCEYCGGSLLDVRTVNDDRTVLAPPPGPIMSSNEKGDCTDAESNPLSLLHGNN